MQDTHSASAFNALGNPVHDDDNAKDKDHGNPVHGIGGPFFPTPLGSAICQD